MPRWVTIASLAEIPPGGRKLCEAEGRRLAIFRLADEVVVIDNHCPHRGGPIGAGQMSEGVLACPWHGLKFDLHTGRCAEPATLALKRWPVLVIENEIQIDLDAEQDPTSDIHRYLIRFGVPGHIGRFGSIARVGCRRGDRALVQTDRGQEIGEVLVAADDYDPSDKRTPAGELLRTLRPEEHAAQEDELAQREALRRQVADSLATLAPDSVVLDVERTFDRAALIVYHPMCGAQRLGPLAVDLATALGEVRVQFETFGGDASRKTASAAARGATETGDDDMRGPYERLKYDFRRVWECPVCRHRERTSGVVTTAFCNCQAQEPIVQQVPMKLIEDGPRRTDGKPLPERKSTLP